MAKKQSKTVGLKGLEGNQLFKAYNDKIGTPVLECEWPHIGEPQTGGKYDGDYGRYTISLVLDPNDAGDAALIERIRKSEAQAKKVFEEWAEVNDVEVLAFRPLKLAPQTVGKGDDKKETGKLLLRLGQDAAKLNKKSGVVTETPVLVKDTKGNNVSVSVKKTVSGGSRLRAAVAGSPYFVSGIGGYSLKLMALQLVELVRFGQNVDLNEFFDDDVDGFTYESDDESDYETNETQAETVAGESEDF